MKRLIVNADDLGFTRGVNAGIFEAHRDGIVTSATIMATAAAFDDAVREASSYPKLGIGVHLVAVGGRPVADPDKIASLVNQKGLFPASLSELALKLIRGAVKTEDIELEFQAQVQRVMAVGIKPTHLDTHKHSHTQTRVMEALARVAADSGIRCVRNPFEALSTGSVAGAAARRQRAVHWKQRLTAAAVRAQAGVFKRIVRRHGLLTTDRFYGVALTGLLDSDAMRSIIEVLEDGSAELMCHPAKYDLDLEQAGTRLKRQRQRELEALTDPLIKRLLEERSIELISYRGLE